MNAEVCFTVRNGHKGIAGVAKVESVGIYAVEVCCWSRYSAFSASEYEYTRERSDPIKVSKNDSRMRLKSGEGEYDYWIEHWIYLLLVLPFDH